MKTLLKKIMQNGQRLEYSKSLRTCIEITNLFSVVSFIFVIPFIFIFRFSFTAWTISTIPMFLHLVTLILIRFGQHKTGRFLFSITTVTTVYLIGSIIDMNQGQDGQSAKFLMLGSIIIPFLVFESREWILKSTTVLIGFICILTFDLANTYLNVINFQNDFDPKGVRTLSVIVAYFMLSGMLFYHSWQIGRYNAELKRNATDLNKMNAMVSKQNEELKENLELIKKKNEQHSTLMRETHHRVKNNFQIIISLLLLQEAKLKSKEDLAVFKDAEDRISTMALLHEKIYRSKELYLENVEDYFANLINGLIRTYDLGKNITLHINIEKTNFGTNTLVPLSLIVNEAVSNSLKYAFRGRENGIITMQLSGLGDNRYELLIGDNGVGMPKENFSEGTGTLGLEIIKTFTDQLNGTIELMDRKGTFYKIHFEAIDPREENE